MSSGAASAGVTSADAGAAVPTTTTATATTTTAAANPFDLDSLVLSRYTGEARLQRLLFVASSSVDRNPELSKQAYRAAAAAMKQAGNVHAYREVFGPKHQQKQQQQQQQQGGGEQQERGGEGGRSTPETTTGTSNSSGAGDKAFAVASAVEPFDAAWCHSTERSNRQAREVLAGRLQAANAHLNKEAIRQAFAALSEHDLRTGCLSEAYVTALRAKDYCTTRHHTATISLRILELALYLKNYPAVKDYVNKLEHTLLGGGGGAAGSASSAGASSSASSEASSSSGGSLANKVLVASALAAMNACDYEKAASKLVRVVCSPGGAASVQWDAVLAAEDVALYAAYLSLACLPRDQVSALAEHVEALELQPAAREALQLFSRRSRYAASWRVLESSLHPVLAADSLVAAPRHLDSLQRMIRERAVLLYWQPYVRVEWSTMLRELGPGICGDTEDELVVTLKDLIRGGSMPRARLDLRARCLVREEDNDDAEGWKENDRYHRTAERLSLLTHRVLDDAHALMIRLACVEHDLVVQDSSSLPHGGPGGGGGGGKRRGRHGGGYHQAAAAAASWAGGPSGDSSEDEMDTHMVDAADAMNPEDLY